MRKGQKILREEIFFYGEEGERRMKRKPNDFNDFFCVKETSFVENGCISCVFQKTEKNKKKAAILYERSSFLFEKQKPL